MKLILAAIAAATFAALFAAPRACADIFVAAGYSFPSPAPFKVIADKDEVCAPAVSALRRLGVTVAVSGAGIQMRAPDGSAITARLDSDRATVDGVERVLPAAPFRRDENIFLPVRAIAWHLGLAYRWDEKTRTIFLHPKVAGITFSRLPEKVRVKISGTAQLSYSAGLLKQPPRIYVDISNADLFAAEQQIAVNEGDLLSVRASQNSLNPDLVRVVLDLKREPTEYFHNAADGGRSIVLDIPAPPLPPAAGGISAVRSVRIERCSDTMFRLVVDANGAPVASLSTRADPPQAVVDLSNARLAAEEVEGSHPLITSATAEQTGENEARIVLNLHGAQPATLVRRPQGVCALIGRVPLNDVTVVIDPGHGGRQSGAIGPSGLQEKTINLAVALRAEKLLQAQGVQVALTRREDRSLVPVTSPEELHPELSLRARTANDRGADLFISIHCNASPRNSTPRTGSETYYTTPRSLGLAKVMQQELVRSLKRKDSGVRTCNFVVTRESRMPAVLLELAYLNDPTEEALLGTPEFQERAARAVAEGVRRFAQEGGLLEYLAELEASRWTQAVVERGPGEAKKAAASPKEAAAPGRADKPGAGGAPDDPPKEGGKPPPNKDAK